MKLLKKLFKSFERQYLSDAIAQERPNLAGLTDEERIDKFIEQSLDEFINQLGEHIGLPDHYLSGGEPIGVRPSFSKLFNRVMDYKADESAGFYLRLSHVIGAESQIFRKDLERLYTQNQIAQVQADLAMKISEKSVLVEQENDNIKNLNTRNN